MIKSKMLYSILALIFSIFTFVFSVYAWFTWDLYFRDMEIEVGSIAVESALIMYDDYLNDGFLDVDESGKYVYREIAKGTQSDGEVNYDIIIDKGYPGEVFTFLLDVKNSGTSDGNLLLKFINITGEMKKIIGMNHTLVRNLADYDVLPGIIEIDDEPTDLIGSLDIFDFNLKNNLLVKQSSLYILFTIKILPYSKTNGLTRDEYNNLANSTVKVTTELTLVQL